MIKKQLSVLAGSMMVAASSNAAIVLDGNALAVFNTAGAGSYYQVVAGSTGDSLAAGQGFSVDISAASSALGGIDSFALLAFGPNICTGPIDIGECYNYTEFLYIKVDGGLIYTGDTATSTTNFAAQIAIFHLDSFLGGADLGYNGEGSLGDFDDNPNVSPYLSTSPTNLVLNAQQGGYLIPIPDSTNAQLLPGTIFIDGNNLTYSGATVPVPAAAWLFGSALLGLYGLRKR